MVQQTYHVDAVGCRAFFSGLSSWFVFDILQIKSVCRQISSGRTAFTCNALTNRLTFPLTDPSFKDYC